MKRILAMLLSVICVLSFTCVSTYADEKSEDEEKAASIAESYLSAAAKNMWLYESNNLAEHTIQELVDPSGNSLLSDMSADVNTQKILSSMDNITFVQEKSKYFREMRQRQDIQRNDFALEYTVTSASIEDNVATLSIIEHISFHYSSFPDTLSELVNYYDVDLIKCNGSWYVSDVTSTNDDFDAIYKGSEFTAEKADEIIALRDAHSLNDTSAIEAIMDDYNLSDNSNATLAGSTTWYNYNATNATAYAYTYVSQMFGKSNWSDFDKDAKEAGRSYYNQNFYDWGQDNTDCQNFASQCIWAGFNGSNAVNQIYNASTREYSPIMDNAGSYKWKGATRNHQVNSASWSCCNGRNGTIGFRKYIANEEATGDPDMIVESGTVSGSNSFASVYQNLKGALLHVDNGAHALIVTDVNGPARSQILICSHTADRKAIAISDFWNSGLIYYFIPQQIKVRNAPDVKITATLIRPVPVGRSLTLGGTTDITCNSLNVTVQSPTGQTFTANSSGRSVGKSVTLTSAGLYTITVTAQKAASSTPVVYVYTVRAY